MNISRASVSHFLLSQTIYLAIAAVIAAIFWASGQQINPGTIIIYSLLFGNILNHVLALLGRFYWLRPFPYNWLLFWFFLLLIVGPVYVLCSAAVWWLAPPAPESLGHLITRGWKFPAVVILVYSSIVFLHRTTRERLEKRNSELQKTIDIGSAELAVQKEELQRAREIQESLLPKTIPQIAGFELAAAWRPAREVSGDYFDVFRLGESKMGFCIADVVGKGVSAALLMANVQAAVRAFASESESPASMCTKVNRLLCENIATGKFVTFLFGVIDSQTQTVSWCNAGHPEPIFVNGQGSRILDHSGAVLGVFPDWKYDNEEIEMHSGDRLLLFTDGITEATGADLSEFGEQRIAQEAQAHHSQTAAELNRTLLDTVDKFCSSRFQDDATLMVIAAK